MTGEQNGFLDAPSPISITLQITKLGYHMKQRKKDASPSYRWYWLYHITFAIALLMCLSGNSCYYYHNALRHKNCTSLIRSLLLGRVPTCYRTWGLRLFQGMRGDTAFLHIRTFNFINRIFSFENFFFKWIIIIFVIMKCKWCTFQRFIDLKVSCNSVFLSLNYSELNAWSFAYVLSIL